MRHSIRTKIILLGSITSFLLISLALLISYLVYQNRAYKTLTNNIDRSVLEIEHNIEESYSLEYLIDMKQRLLQIYNESPDDPVFTNYDQAFDYYSDKYNFIYPSNHGLGLSYEKATLKNTYLSLSNYLSSAVISSGGTKAFIAYYDQARDRNICLVDSNFIFDESQNPNIPFENYRFFGSYYQYTEADAYVDETQEYWSYIINGKRYRVTSIESVKDGNYIYEFDIFIQYSEDEIHKSIFDFFITELIFFSIVFIVLVGFFVLLSHFLIAKNIIKLTNSTKSFTSQLDGDNDLKVINPLIYSRDEIGDLSNSFVALEESIVNYVDQIEKDTKEREKINAELELASRIQLEALPANNLNDANVLINASIKSAKEIGGDFYDYFYVDDKHLAIIISDVSGKGVPAALFMMKSKELIKSKLLNKEELSKVVYDVNNTLLDNNTQGLFITAFIGVLDLSTKVLKFINAGHERPFIISKNEVRRLDVNSNFILGGIENFKYKVDEIKLHEDDKLFLHTDGLNESINSNKEEFGYDRILKTLDDCKNSQNVDVLAHMKQNLASFVGEEEAFDDVTMLILELKTSKLHFEFNNPNYDIINIVTNKFNDYYSYVDVKVVSEVDIILDELLNNYISYEKKDGLIISIDIDIKDDSFIFTFKNNGMEFNPLKKEDKHIEEFNEDMPIGGLGITIIKKLSTDISYERKNNMNVLVIKKNIK